MTDTQQDEFKTLVDDLDKLKSKRPTKIGFTRMRKQLLKISKWCSRQRQDLLKQRKAWIPVRKPSRQKQPMKTTRDKGDPVAGPPKLVREPSRMKPSKSKQRGKKK